MAPKKLARCKAGAEQSKLEEESKEPKRNWLSTEDCTVAALADSVHKTLGKVSDPVKEAAMTARWPDALQLHYERVGWPSTSKKLDPPHTCEWSRDNRIRKKNKGQRWSTGRRAGGRGAGRPKGGPGARGGWGRLHRRAPRAWTAGAAAQAGWGRWERRAGGAAHVCMYTVYVPANVCLCESSQCTIILNLRVYR